MNLFRSWLRRNRWLIVTLTLLGLTLCLASSLVLGNFLYGITAWIAVTILTAMTITFFDYR